MRTRRVWSLACGGVCMWLSSGVVGIGCVPEPPPPDQRASGVIVVTRFDPAFDFGSPSTFAIVPQVALVSGIDAGMVPAAQSQAIIGRIVENMVSRGYEQTSPAARPDLGINVTLLVQIQVVQAPTSGFWWGAPGFTPPGFWGLAGAAYGTPWAYATDAFKSITLVIELLDVRGALRTAALDDGGAPEAASPESPAVVRSDAGGFELPIVWAAYIHGAIALGVQVGPSALGTIDQAFAQSPFLEKR